MSKILIDEATVKLALEALEYIYEGANNQGPHTGISWRCVSNKAEPVITALREALAEQPAPATELREQEPYGYVSTHTNGLRHFNKTFQGVYRDTATEIVAVYTSPQPAQQEPVAWMTKTGSVWKTKADETDIPLYTSPPAQRTWVGLTDEEVINVMPDDDTPMSLGEAFSKFAELIEAKLKEKNT